MSMPYKRRNANKKHPLYWTWNSMFVRCYYPSHKQYADYGGRGISVSPDWFDFNKFVEDMGPRPSLDHQLDRADNNGGYTSTNCVWIPSSQNKRNTRRTIGREYGAESAGVWYMYLLTSGSRTYIGITTDLARRLRQHNGELAGGARSTGAFRGQWKMLMYVSGFSSKSEACRWERIVKSRARGIIPRRAAFRMLVNGVCPKGRAEYVVPTGLHLTEISNDW